MAYDVLTMGEALLRLTPPDFRRIEQSTTLEMHIGGSELNTAVGLARLGLRVAWLSRLTDNVLGRWIAQTLVAQGVNHASIVWTPHDRLGIYYMEEGRGARPSQVTYDRAGSAMSRITPDDLALETLLESPPRLLHISGITPALSDSCAATTLHLLEACRARAVPFSFDLNYRAKLWDIDTAKRVCEPFMQAAHLVFIAARDALAFYGTDRLDDLHARYPHATLVMTRGAHGAESITPHGHTMRQPIYPTETVCRIGGGDAFSAGYLFAHLAGMDGQACLRYGAASAALKYSMAGDMPLIDRAQLEALVRSGGGDVQR